MTKVLGPGSTVGILGGGQLGRMLAIAAAQLGLKAHIYAPEDNPPAGEVAGAVTQGAYDDATRLAEFAAQVDVVTYEFENVPAETVDILEPLVAVRPGRMALSVAQDRIVEKTFLNGIGVATAPFAAINDADDMSAAMASIGSPAILKTCRLGYDGKGQARVMEPADADSALADMAGAPAIFEGFVPFVREISVIAARGVDGTVSAYDPGQNEHEGGILRRTTVPAPLDRETLDQAMAIATKIVDALDYVGVIGVELFETADGFLVNEIAPRVHNTGHWTIEACATDQFQQHIRAVCGWGLGSPLRHSAAVMTNLIGDDFDDWAALSAEPGAALHLYGKGEARPGRKMGHVTVVSPVLGG
ncbi:MAG: 5-(carboxyamino)imidazole ribonucleotide synthase [Pikeienuella sp.]